MLGGGGFVADHYLDTGPWCLLGGLMAGLALGFYQLGRVLKHRRER
jgi:F0F1-type ATP synthase assembly protein I